MRVLVFLATLCVLVGLTFHQGVAERVHILLSRDAQVLYSYANLHFDATHPNEYDLERAERLFEQALSQDASLPYVRHQLARIKFLKGDFVSARELIDEEIAMFAGSTVSPSSYYIRGLIHGFSGNYSAAADDYRTYLFSDPTNWAATNDLAWVLLKDGKYDETVEAIEPVLTYWPHNPWLLNSLAIAQFERGQIAKAQIAVKKAGESVHLTTASDWLRAYPGNDPPIAETGLEAFRKAVFDNMHRIRTTTTPNPNRVQ